MFVAIAIIGLACWHARHNRKDLRTAAVLFPFVLAWPIYVHLRGIPTDIHAADVIAFFTFKARVWRRIGPTMQSLSHYGISIFLVALVCTLLGLAVARQMRRRLDIGSTGWSWSTFAAMFIALASAYIVASDNLKAHLDSSASRVTIAPRLLLLTEASI